MIEIDIQKVQRITEANQFITTLNQMVDKTVIAKVIPLVHQLTEIITKDIKTETE